MHSIVVSNNWSVKIQSKKIAHHCTCRNGIQLLIQIVGTYRKNGRRLDPNQLGPSKVHNAHIIIVFKLFST